MASHKNQEFQLEIRLLNQPGILNLGLVFRGKQSAFDTWVGKWPDMQNDRIHFARATWHRFGEDTVVCEFSPTGYCYPADEYRYQDWHPADVNDLYFSLADILAKCEMYITDEEAQAIWDQCILFWNEPAMDEIKQLK